MSRIKKKKGVRTKASKKKKLCDGNNKSRKTEGYSVAGWSLIKRATICYESVFNTKKDVQMTKKVVLVIE